VTRIVETKLEMRHDRTHLTLLVLRRRMIVVTPLPRFVDITPVYDFEFRYS